MIRIQSSEALVAFLIDWRRIFDTVFSFVSIVSEITVCCFYGSRFCFLELMILLNNRVGLISNH